MWCGVSVVSVYRGVVGCQCVMCVCVPWCGECVMCVCTLASVRPVRLGLLSVVSSCSMEQRSAIRESRSTPSPWFRASAVETLELCYGAVCIHKACDRPYAHSTNLKLPVVPKNTLILHSAQLLVSSCGPCQQQVTLYVTLT